MNTPNNSIFALKLIAVLGCGLMAGLFFAFSAFVMKALSRLPPQQGISAMQSINVSILNPLFLAVFMGTALACVLTMIYAFKHWSQSSSSYLLAGSVFYLVGCLMVTGVCNVPMNDALEAVKPDNPHGATIWADYLTTWTLWNHVRTIATIAATAAFAIACGK